MQLLLLSIWNVLVSVSRAAVCSRRLKKIFCTTYNTVVNPTVPSHRCRSYTKSLVITMGNFLSISVPRFKYTHSKESTPPTSMCRWFRVVMEVVRWRLAWSNCFMSLVISLTCAGTSQTGKANNPQGERVGKTTWNEGGGQSTQKGKEEAQKGECALWCNMPKRQSRINGTPTALRNYFCLLRESQPATPPPHNPIPSSL